jgi:hypothetical protein
MFNWFKSKKPAYRHRDMVWPTAEAKWRALPGLVQANHQVQIFGWFPATIEKAENTLALRGLRQPVKHARQYSSGLATGATIIMLEHHPLPAQEEAILKAEETASILVLMAMDEPLFTRFGGERLTSLMQKLGVGDDEVIEHSMISSSLRRAQEKLAEKAIVDFTAQSQEEWFRRLSI